MNYPKQKFQPKYMGKTCSFTAEYIKTYLKKQIGRSDLYSFRNTESIPVRWKIQKHMKQTGWIVGFGYCYDGTIKDDPEEGRYFHKDKRINYVRVRKTPNSQEIKVPIEFLVLTFE